MDIDKKIAQLIGKIAECDQRIAETQARKKEYQKQLDSLRYLRYTETLNELEMTDDELIAFLKSTNVRQRSGQEKGEVQ